MLMIPAIDLYQGRCVRLRQGQFNQVTTYDAAPNILATQYAEQGAKCLHIVDLEGAKLGSPQQLNLIGAIKSCGIPIQAGGGIRSLADAQAFLAQGISRIVLGSIAISNPLLTKEIITEIQSDKIVLAVDVNIEQGIPMPAINGWQTSTQSTLWDVVSEYQQLGITHILCTSIDSDGMMNGPNFNLYQEAISRFPSLAWQASGGIRHRKDIDALSTMGLSAAIVGRALYETELGRENLC